MCRLPRIGASRVASMEGEISRSRQSTASEAPSSPISNQITTYRTKWLGAKLPLERERLD